MSFWRERIWSSVRRRRVRPFILGLRDSIPEAASLSSKEIYRLAGRNTGNFVFTAAIRSQVANWGDPPNVALRAASARLGEKGGICVIPGANKLGPHMDMGAAAEVLQNARTPVVTVSLGAQSNVDYRVPEIPEGTLRWVKAIADRRWGSVENIGVRGDFPRRVLAAYGFDRVRVIGCPSFFLNPTDRLGELIARNAAAMPTRVAVAAGGPGRRHLSRIESSLAQIVTETAGAYICQAPFTMVALARGDFGALSEAELEACREYVDGATSISAFTSWIRRHARVFFDVWTWMEFLRGFDFVVGTRIHGVLMGIQVGVPGICVVSDSRTRELCETMDIPHVLSRDHRDGLDRVELMGLFREQFDAGRFDSKRRRLAANYLTFLEGNGLTVKGSLRSLARAA
ncbi:MAG: polysaccharide pyruvyl transferase family protein [Gammaproteobacteria bacterium]|nr:polysaccharide pyruvyl transferase family protein [Gammaproteobacteria bacterium]